MSHDMQTALWGTAVCLPVLLNIWTRQRSDALGLSGMVLLIWCCGRVLGALYTPPESMTLYPVIDLCAGFTVLTAWHTRRARWKFALLGLYVGQLAAHAAFWIGWPEHSSLVRYLGVNNTLFALQLMCVAWPGGSYVARRLGDYLSGGPWALHHSRG